MYTRARLGLAMLAALCGAAPPLVVRLEAADKAPAWMGGVMRETVSVAPGDSPAVVLLDERVVDIGANGRRTTRQRQVIRILKREARDLAVASLPFEAKLDKLGTFQAWLVTGDGRTRAYGRKDVVELATSLEALYADGRAAVIDASAEAGAGSTFGWEATLDELSTLGQDIHLLQRAEPVAVARVVVRVPKGWRVDGILLGHPPVAPYVTGESYAWELRDLPGVKPEPLGPGIRSIAAQLAYDLRPPKPVANFRTFSSWEDNVTYALELHNRAARPDAAITAKARELCAGVATPWEKIRALATFAQDMRYIAIAMNLGTGGGFTPHDAGEVLRCSYGDCKDKTTVLRALLAAEGLRGWPVLCFSGDPLTVREDWPSPIQFNHVLTAIELGDIAVPDTTFVMDHPGVGRVLLFDPTDPHTRIGDFPDYNQGARVLICSPGTTGLSRVPIAPPQNNHTRRRAKVGVDPNGVGRIGTYEVLSGAPAARARAEYQHEAALRETVEKQLQAVHPGLQLSRAELGTTAVPDQLTLRLGFGVPQFSRALRDQLLVFNPVLRLREAPTPLPAGPRAQPVLLPSLSVDDATEFLLPEGFAISEISPAVTLERTFGSYELQPTPAEGKITVRRRLILRGGEHPASDYEEVRSFFEGIRKAETTPIVLERTPASGS